MPALLRQSFASTGQLIEAFASEGCEMRLLYVGDAPQALGEVCNVYEVTRVTSGAQ